LGPQRLYRNPFLEDIMQRTIRYPGRLAAGALLVLALAACSETSAPLAPSEGPAQFSRAAAQAGFFPLDIQYSDTEMCADHGGLAVWTVLSGNLKVASVQSRNGGGLRIVEILANGRISLAANGRTLRSALAGTVFYGVDEQDNLVDVTFVGLNGVFTVPGEGRIALETGRLVIDGSGNVVFEAGPHDVFGSDPDVARLCAYLGG
jgi:hypothetical protein